MLLVLLAPLVSRWLAHGHVAAAVPVAAMDHAMHAEHAQHAMEGHHDHHAMAMPHGDAAKKPPADPHADHEMGVDCDYCLIAARLITLLVAAVLLLAPMAPVCRALRGAVRALPQRISGTLGARGPPAMMAA
ncbi:TPA: DUF2946 domain-containing protein [Stenotrophomonas maltophilia]|uniref:DUF2946 family protein n=1 Tax=Stenotrophomonas maltophilia group sp. Smal13 TaxID=3377166 RepID=UPI001312FF61|nr:DUF2946 family protein [Stenotrophomonas maltophilia]EKU9959948.1 DUF2946 domain-containing protein [Stenotrophomonas maltophilia]EKU9961713.1 DUF2946 domain-containing protein [Stenotrophomonas maltophilia]EKU9985618.1 DUF2946 domain-containing protein [Stenotrophomonas maltophilia]EKU9988030.1 DUF2946 domain-containing protein [Stenotrophomonas maltophilia]HEL5041646.1 DUF2946 domain-containing protein [Stenotrophomonas maltophilia]